MALLMLTGCGTDKGSASEQPVEVDDAIVQLDVPQVEEGNLEHENPLTGLNDMTDEGLGKRPVAVMVNNIAAALPQYGVAEADVIFEIPVEGNQTRLMTMYADYTKVPKICAVRSCRYYYPAISEGFDAIYVHWGQDGTIKEYLNSLNLTRFNGIDNTGKLFGRDKDRRNAGYSLEHTGYFDGTGLVEATKKLEMRTELSEDKKGTAFQFCENGKEVTPTGETCVEAYINFGAQSSTFNYDAETGKYFKLHNNNKHIDAVTEEQLAFENIFILETSITRRDEKDRKKVDWQGSEDAVGYYISKGMVQKINWSKADEKSYLKFFTEDGQELVINRGKIFIAYCTKNQASFK